MTVTLGLRLHQDPSEIDGRIVLLALAEPGTRARLLPHAERLRAYLAAQLHFLRRHGAELDPSDLGAAAELAPHLEAARQAEQDASHILAFLTHLEVNRPGFTGEFLVQ